MPKISIIVPVYNPGEWLHECMHSVLAQDINDIEVVCVDDGSTDGSLDRLNEYATRDNRVKVFSQPNSGAAVARNKGIDEAKGEFVAFMDPDDYYPDAHVLSILYDKANANSVDICGGCMMQFYPDGRKIEHYSGLNSGYEFQEEGIIEYSAYQFEYGYTRFIYRRGLIDDWKVRFPLFLRFQDPPFFVESMQRAKRFYAVPIVTYAYRVTDQTKKVDWSGSDYLRARHYIRGMSKVLSIAKQEGFHDLTCRTLERIFCAAGRFLWHEGIADHIIEDIDLLLSLYAPKVSIVVPVYNVERYVGECLDSLLAQRYRNLEVICVNDGSSDDSLRVVESYREKFSGSMQFIVHNQPNGGLSAARNAGMKIATGKYIYFCDSDDKIAPETIGELVVISEKERLDQVIFSSEVFIEGDSEDLVKRAEGFRRYYTLPKEVCSVVKRGEELFRMLVDSGRFHVSQPLRFYRLSPLKDNGCQFPVGMLCEDNYFAPVSLRYAERAMAYNRRYYQRRVREGSIMTSTGDYAPRLHGVLGVIVALCEEKNLWNYSEEFSCTLSKFISLLSRALGWHCRSTPYEKWEGAVKDIAEKSFLGNPRLLTEFVLPLLKDRAVEILRGNKLDRANKELQQKRGLLTEQIKQHKDMVDTLRVENCLVKQDLSRLKAILSINKRSLNEVAALKKSESYRIGLIVTWPLRKVYRGIKRLLENGMRHTLCRLVFGKVLKRKTQYLKKRHHENLFHPEFVKVST